MRFEMLIVSHEKDLPWLRHCLASIAKFASGFSGVTVVWPSKTWTLAKFSAPVPRSLKFRFFDEFPRKGMCDAMAQKLMADIHCPDVDYIFHVDSDCVFREPFTPEDYFVDGKPALLMERYDDIKARKDSGSGRFQWQAVVEETLGFKPEFETMCRHPMVNPIGVYAGLREHIEKRWGMPFRSYVLTGRNEYPQTFAEFNTLGAWCYEHHRNEYYWLQIPENPRPKDKLLQFWGHSPPHLLQSTWIDNKEVVVCPENLIKQMLA